MPSGPSASVRPMASASVQQRMVICLCSPSKGGVGVWPGVGVAWPVIADRDVAAWPCTSGRDTVPAAVSR
jgi:hypothetical protein